MIAEQQCQFAVLVCDCCFSFCGDAQVLAQSQYRRRVSNIMYALEPDHPQKGREFYIPIYVIVAREMGVFVGGRLISKSKRKENIRVWENRVSVLWSSRVGASALSVLVWDGLARRKCLAALWEPPGLQDLRHCLSHTGQCNIGVTEAITMSQAPKSNAQRPREPPPSLFLGPPSQNASNVSLPGSHHFGARLEPTITAATMSSTTSRIPMSRRGSRGIVPRTGDFSDGKGSGALPHSLPRIQLENQRQADRTDALWAQMQSTLEEVELTAVNGTHVFGGEHTKALEGLRQAQIALAQAWARSEADDAVETIDRDMNAVKSSGAGSEGRSGVQDTAEGRSNAKSGSARPGSSAGPANMDSKLGDETEADIRLARRRREANDQYFSRVNAGVLDVVDKLEEVAKAMRAVEKESRDIWDESETSLSSDNPR